jgi:hypothetical protein
MKHWTEADKKSAKLTFALNYMPKGFKEVVTDVMTIKLVDLSDKEYKALLAIIDKHSYRSRKMSVKLNKETNGKKIS